MPDISSELSSILYDTYGEQVRDSTVKAIKTINNYGIGTVDSAPTPYSQHPAKSGGIYDAIQLAANEVDQIMISVASDWTTSEPYSKSLNVSGITSLTKVDIIPDSALIAQMREDSIRAIWIQNNGGALTAYTLGGKPSVVINLIAEGVIQNG